MFRATAGLSLDQQLQIAAQLLSDGHGVMKVWTGTTRRALACADTKLLLRTTED